MPVIRQKRSGNITKSGAITVLPKNQLKSLDNLQGAIPLDLSINGHELINTDLKFDDSSRNYVFGQSYAFGNISEGIPSEDDYYGNIISSPNTVGTSFSKNGTLSKEFLKDPRQRSNLSVSFRPYKEENQIEIDRANEFYVSGTSPLVSANFQQSLLSREKIEIDVFTQTGITSPTSTTFKRPGPFQSYALNSFSYFNFKTKDWDTFNGFPTSDGESERKYTRLPPGPYYSTTQLSSNPERFALPFSPSSWNRRTSPVEKYQFVSGSISEPISNFGFPYSKKFKPYEDNLISMKNYINKPFLLEKVIIKCKKSNFFELHRDLNNNQFFPYPVTVTTNIFILNNRAIKSNRNINKSINDECLTVDSNNQKANLNGDIDKENIRELVTYAKIISSSTGSLSHNDIYGTRETYNFDKIIEQADFFNYVEETADFTDPSDSSILLEELNTEVQIEVPVRQSIKTINNSHLQMWPVSGKDYYTGNEHGSRTLLGKDLNKSLVNNSENYASIKNFYASDFNSSIEMTTLDSDNRQVPYILYPEDNITIGVSSFSNFYFDSDFYFSSYISDTKLILVGTPINDDRPKFEFDKRFLTSKNLRAGIVGDKFNTDRFDTLPIHFYASSSIDKIIESTGNRIIDRAVSGYYSNGNRGTHLKAVELQNSDISLTGSLLSEKAHFNYNSFGNFSDLYSQRKNTSYFKTGDNVVIYPVEKKFYDTDGNKLHQTGTLSFNSDFNAKISTWFEES